MKLRATVLLAALSFASPALAAGAGSHADPVAPAALALLVLLLAATVGGEIATRLGQPAVLGELLAGVAIGNLELVGLPAADVLADNAFIDMLARLGVLLLLFEVGLESTVAEMLRVGLSSLAVATLGVAAPFALGWAAGAWLVPEQGPYVHAFLGATLCATSVGITARVLQDLERAQTPEARVILGAAVIDDVLGLVILAVVSAVVVAADRGGSVSPGEIAATIGKAAGFLVGALAIGAFVSPRLFAFGARLRRRGVMLSLGLCLCFLLSYLANVVGLAPIIGAFAAGLVLEASHFRAFRERGEGGLDALIHPIASFLVPVFFVDMGIHTDLRAFAEPGTLGLAAALSAAAVLGKQVCSLGVVGGGVDRWTVGIGMVPRGEVGLIFANVGATLTLAGQPLVSKPTYSALVAMVIATTMVTPPALKWSVGRASSAG